MQTPLFTGFPGFISRQVMKELIEQEKVKCIYAVVLPSQMEAGIASAAILMQANPQVSIRLIEGDITLPHLGIQSEELNVIQNEIDTVWHLAAIYDLAVPKEAAWLVNVKGTAMVNDFVKTLPKLKKYMYFSTAYVAGTRQGLLKEDELIRPKAFKNFYEESKFEAEVLVEKLKSDIPITIIRPGIVRGHSVTGETVKFDGPYFFINMIEKLKSLPIIPFIGKSTSNINVVPIEFITKSVVYLSETEKANRKTVHLTDPHPHPVEEVFRKMVFIITGKKPKGRMPLAFAKLGLKSKFLRQQLGVEQETLDYLTWSAHFDTTQATDLLKDSGVRCSDFLESLPAMIAFYDLHKHEPEYHVHIK